MPRLIQMYLPDATLEGVRIIEVSESAVKAFVVPRIKLNDIKDESRIRQPSLYLLINSGENQVYIGEAENFYDRVKNHDQNKDFWDTAVAIVSTTNSLEKSDIKYLESLAVEKAKATAAMEVLNKTVPSRNNIHEFKLHSLQMILEDIALIAQSLGFSLFSTKQDDVSDVWYCKTRKTDAKAQFRGSRFVVLAGSVIDGTERPLFPVRYPSASAERRSLLAEKAQQREDNNYELTENITFKSPNHAGGFCVGGNINAWTTWKNANGKTMDEVIRKDSA